MPSCLQLQYGGRAYDSVQRLSQIVVCTTLCPRLPAWLSVCAICGIWSLLIDHGACGGSRLRTLALDQHSPSFCSLAEPSWQMP